MISKLERQYEDALHDYHTAPKHLREIVAQDLRKARAALMAAKKAQSEALIK
jgi:hypothetical protein